MRRSTLFLLAAAAAAASLILPAGASSRATADLTPIEAFEPADGQVVTAGTQIAFRVRTSAGGTIWLAVSTSAAAADPCGRIGYDAHIDSFEPTAADPTVYESVPPVYTFAGYWSATPGTYYWQAYRIEYGEGADGCIESPVRALTIVAATPKPPPKPAPKPKPKAPLALTKARLAGTFTVNERVTAAAGSLADVGDTDSLDFTFTPQCSKGACPSRLALRFAHPSHMFTASHVARATFAKKGVTYRGRAGGPFAECMMSDVNGTMTVTLRVTRGAWMNGVWRATRFTGTERVEVPYSSHGTFYCSASSYTATIKGTLQK